MDDDAVHCHGFLEGSSLACSKFSLIILMAGSVGTDVKTAFT